jgi:hydrogenase-4 component B
MTLGLPFLIAFLALTASVVAGFRRPGIWLALTVTGAVAGLVAALAVLLGGDNWEWRSSFLLGGESLHLRLDGLSALFLVLVSVVGGTGAIYSREYWSDQHQPASAPRGRAWWSAFLISMGLVLTVANGLHFLIAWELFAICGYFLIGLCT